MSLGADHFARTSASSGTTEELRRSNLARILTLIHRGGALSRAELTRLTGLNRSTIGGLVAELRELGLAFETMPGSGEGNRAGRPSPVVHPSQSVVAIAVNPEVDAIHIGLVALGGRVLKRIRLETEAAPTSREVVEMTRAAIAGLVAGSEQALTIVGIGLAVPGLVRRSDGQVRIADHLDWIDEPLTEMMSMATGHRTVAANAAQLGMRAESLFGAGRGVDDLVYLIGGASGIGGGVVTGGQLLTGADGYAAEFGHTFVTTNGTDCTCGSQGCLEAEVTQSELLDAVGLGAAQAELLAGLIEASDDPAVAELVARDVALVRVAVRNAVNLFNPRLIIVGGFLTALFPTGDGLAAEALSTPREELTVALAELGADQLLIGAGELVFSQLLLDPASSMGTELPLTEM
ncbi:ROK family protein [Subtercola sp. PAMC28395]|uniref:ROK family transcriptional regulator n=1 Tax=Subtercola sp. PAMC28395 TaxID=2846775 RepID=UPI001C0DF914|nr:ROK family transcriptional regulator [Subtercola sp. PAMC28395]QWT25072.1 ROK family protein [Subtercola sp. PAMC28395]